MLNVFHDHKITSLNINLDQLDLVREETDILNWPPHPFSYLGGFYPLQASTKNHLGGEKPLGQLFDEGFRE